MLIAINVPTVQAIASSKSEGAHLSLRTNVLLIAANALLLLSCIVGYWYALAGRYGGEGYIPGESGVSLFLAALLGVSCSALCISRDPFLAFALQFINWFIVIPMIVIAHYGAGATNLLWITIFGFAVICLLARIVLTLPDQKFGSEEAFENVMLSIAFFVVILTLAFGGIANFNLDFSKVYDFRESAAAELPSLFEYARPLAVVTIIPLGIAIALSRNKVSFLVSYGLVCIALFALTAHKTIFFVPIFVIAAFFSMRLGGRYLWIWPVALGSIALLSAIEVTMLQKGLLDQDWITSLFFRRTMFTPSMLNYIFYDVFFGYPKYYWADSRITLGLIDPPYLISAPYLVGVVRFSDVDLAANTGWVGSGLAQAGVAGVMIYSSAIGLFVALMRAASQRAGRGLVAAASVMQLSTLTRDADLMTTLLTHGLAIFLMLIILLPNRIAPSKLSDRLPPKQVAME